jgi:hypothetical protein
VNPMMGDPYTGHSWEIPPSASNFINYKAALSYLLLIQSTRLRSVGQWDVYATKDHGLQFYYDSSREMLRYVTPDELSWKVIMRGSRQVASFGYGHEWSQFEDEYGNIFYRNDVTREHCWDRPYDAIEVRPKERMCSAFLNRSKAIEQKWYTCEQCNRAWKLAPEGAKLVLKLCEPCAFRCHVGHKGVRLVRTSMSLCLCPQVCKLSDCRCCAKETSPEQLETQEIAKYEAAEKKRKMELNVLMPPVFANVPTHWPDGTKKSKSGWRMCRRPADLHSLPKKTIDIDDLDHDSGDDEDDNKSLTSNYSGSVIDGRPITNGEYNALLQCGDDFPYSSPDELPNGWVEVVDVEEREVLEVGARVLVTPRKRPVKMYGRVVSMHKPGFYVVYIDAKQREEIICRANIETISGER